MNYRHRQTARFAPLLIVVIFAVSTIVVILAGAWPVIIPLLGLLVVIGPMMARMTVVVDATEVVVTMGWGWPKRRIPLADVAGVARVRNDWWRGWGIRRVPRGWMYNVAGRDTVELELRAGNVFRIGTDDPDGLLAAVQSAL